MLREPAVWILAAAIALGVAARTGYLAHDVGAVRDAQDRLEGPGMGHMAEGAFQFLSAGFTDAATTSIVGAQAGHGRWVRSWLASPAVPPDLRRGAQARCGGLLDKDPVAAHGCVRSTLDRIEERRVAARMPYVGLASAAFVVALTGLGLLGRRWRWGNLAARRRAAPEATSTNAGTARKPAPGEAVAEEPVPVG